MFSDGSAHKISAGIGNHGDQERHQNIEFSAIAAIHTTQAHQRADQERIDNRAEQRNADRSEFQFRMPSQQLTEQQRSKQEQANQRRHPKGLLADDAASEKPRPHHHRDGHNGGAGNNSLMLQNAGAPEHFIGTDRAGKRKQDCRCNRRKQQNDHQQQRQSHRSGKNTNQHYSAPPKRRLRPLYEAIAFSSSSGVKSGQSTSVK